MKQKLILNLIIMLLIVNLLKAEQVNIQYINDNNLFSHIYINTITKTVWKGYLSIKDCDFLSSSSKAITNPKLTLYFSSETKKFNQKHNENDLPIWILEICNYNRTDVLSGIIDIKPCNVSFQNKLIRCLEINLLNNENKSENPDDNYEQYCVLRLYLTLEDINKGRLKIMNETYVLSKPLNDQNNLKFSHFENNLANINLFYPINFIDLKKSD